jgi:dephospho-CoA kinase
MKTIGLIGGVASGKSLVADMLVELGAGRLDADAAGHGLLERDAVVRAALRQRWGDDVFNGDGSVNRAAVARRVFGAGEEATAEREFLEELLHPRIGEDVKARATGFASEGRPAVVLDAPLLLEAGWGPMCDVILMVDASRETRLGRALNRGWSEAEFNEREAAQWPIVKKRAVADVVINNDGTEAELRREVQRFWKDYIEANTT